MKKYAFWSAMLLMSLGTISIIIGAYYIVNHLEFATAFFKGGIVMELAGALWFFLSQKRIKQHS